MENDDDASRDDDEFDDDDLDEEFLNEQLTNSYNRTYTDSFIDSLRSLPPAPDHNLTRIQPTVKRLPVEPFAEPTNQILEFDWDLDPAEDKHKWHHKKKKKKKHHHHKKKKVSFFSQESSKSLPGFCKPWPIALNWIFVSYQLSHQPSHLPS